MLSQIHSIQIFQLMRYSKSMFPSGLFKTSSSSRDGRVLIWDKRRLIAYSINEFVIREQQKERFKSGIFLHTLSRLVKDSSVSPWQAAGVRGVSLLSESSTSLSGDISNSDFMFLGTLWGEKTKTLHNLLNSLRSLTRASWINQTHASGYHVISSFTR